MFYVFFCTDSFWFRVIYVIILINASTLWCITSENGQVHFKNLAAFLKFKIFKIFKIFKVCLIILGRYVLKY